MLTEDGLTIILQRYEAIVKEAALMERMMNNHRRNLDAVTTRMGNLEVENKALWQRIKEWEQYADEIEDVCIRLSKKHKLKFVTPAQPLRDLPF
jgi:hypothetical protein